MIILGFIGYILWLVLAGYLFCKFLEEYGYQYEDLARAISIIFIALPILVLLQFMYSTSNQLC
jgi:membrane protein DedA with SNARE-associated domain